MDPIYRDSVEVNLVIELEVVKEVFGVDRDPGGGLAQWPVGIFFGECGMRRGSHPLYTLSIPVYFIFVISSPKFVR